MAERDADASVLRKRNRDDNDAVAGKDTVASDIPPADDHSDDHSDDDVGPMPLPAKKRKGAC